MTAVPALPTVLPPSGKITSTNWDLMVAYLTFQRNPPRFKGAFTGTNSISSGSAILFPSIVDSASGYNAGTGQYTVQYAGTYFVTAAMKWGTSPGSTTGMTITKGGSAIIISPDAPNTNFMGPQLSDFYTFAAGDVIAATVNHSFSTQNDGGDNNYLNLVWIGA